VDCVVVEALGGVVEGGHGPVGVPPVGAGRLWGDDDDEQRAGESRGCWYRRAC
jgi:hypothetical protein